MNLVLSEMVMFPTMVYTADRPDFLPIVREVSNEYLNKRKINTQLNEIYPVYQTDNFFDDARLTEFVDFVGQSSWEILDSQGYAMNNFNVAFSEMWLHDHHKYSGMEQHIHGYGSQITGFYFTQCPKSNTRVIFHDPRPAKVQINLPDRNINEATQASSMINFEPREGMFMFTNAWLPHTFSKHDNDIPFQFVHFNLYADPVHSCKHNVEIV